MMDKTTNTASPRGLSEDELAMVSAGARFNPQPDPPGIVVSHNPPAYLTGTKPHNPPTY